MLCQIRHADIVFVRLISLFSKHLLQYSLFKSFTVPSTSLTKFPKKFYTKLLASAFVFTKFSTNSLWYVSFK